MGGRDCCWAGCATVCGAAAGALGPQGVGGDSWVPPFCRTVRLMGSGCARGGENVLLLGSTLLLSWKATGWSYSQPTLHTGTWCQAVPPFPPVS